MPRALIAAYVRKGFVNTSLPDEKDSDRTFSDLLLHKNDLRLIKFPSYDENDPLKDTNLKLWGLPHVFTAGLGPSQIMCWRSASLQKAARVILMSFLARGGLEDEDLKVCK
eukprot:123486-Rhodomonas_salina.1